MALLIAFYFFFFFKAEDGIRDYKVTGVQTCALPISCCARPSDTSRRPAPPGTRSTSVRGQLDALNTRRPGPAALARPIRSEERRVGKECRSRWSPYH